MFTLAKSVGGVPGGVMTEVTDIPRSRTPQKSLTGTRNDVDGHEERKSQERVEPQRRLLEDRRHDF